MLISLVSLICLAPPRPFLAGPFTPLPMVAQGDKYVGAIPPLARTLTLAFTSGQLSIKDMKAGKSVAPLADIRLYEGYRLSVGPKAYADVRLDSIGYARLNSKYNPDAPVSLAYITRLDAPAKTWYKPASRQAQWRLQITMEKGKLMTRRSTNWIDTLMQPPILRVNGFGINTVGRGTAWSLDINTVRTKETADDRYTVLVGRHAVEVGTFLPSIPAPNPDDKQDLWRYAFDQSHQNPATLASPLREGSFRPITVEAKEKLIVVGDPMRGPFTVSKPMKIEDKDWPEIVEMISMGLVRIPTLYLPPRLAEGYQGTGVSIAPDRVAAFLAPGEPIRQRFERFQFKPLGEALRGLDMRDEPTQPFEIRQIIQSNQRLPKQLLQQIQLIAQIELVAVEFENVKELDENDRPRYRQTARVVLDLNLQDTFGNDYGVRNIEVNGPSRVSRQAITAAASLADPNGTLNRAFYRAVAEAFWMATDEQTPLRWRGEVASWSGTSTAGNGSVDVPKSAGLYKGQRLKVLRQVGTNPRELTPIGSVEITTVNDSSIFIKAVDRSGDGRVLQAPRFQKGDLVEEEDLGSR